MASKPKQTATSHNAPKALHPLIKQQVTDATQSGKLDVERLLEAVSACYSASSAIAEEVLDRGLTTSQNQFQGRTPTQHVAAGGLSLPTTSLDLLDDGVIMVDHRGRIALINKAAWQLLGLEVHVPRAALAEAPLREAFRHVSNATEQRLSPAADGSRQPGAAASPTLEDLITAIADGELATRFEAAPLTVSGKVGGDLMIYTQSIEGGNCLLTVRASHEQAEQVRRLRMAEQEYNSLFDNAVIGIYRSSIEGRQLRANPALVRLNGYRTEDDLLKSVNDIAREWYVQPGRRETFRREMLEKGRITDFVSEVYRHNTRERIWVSENAWLVRDLDGNPLYFEGTVVDASDRMAAEEEISHLAHHDHLTGLPNRFMLLKKLREAILQPHTASSVAVLCLDLDHFKDVNDTLGHQAGDRLLVSVGKRLRRSIKAGDTLARLGGDEFTILQTGVRNRRDSEALARRIVRTLNEPFMIGENQVNIGVSVGVASFQGQEPAELLRDADVALYEAKKAGRKTYAFYTEAMGEALRDRRELEDDLRVAIEKGEFQLYLQPIVCAQTAEVKVYEALLRWDHPARGAVSPSRFVSIAEESSLMLALGDWVLEKSVQTASRLPRGRRLAMNLSPLQLRDPKFVQRVSDTLKQYKVEADRLELEITETVIMSDDARTMQTLNELRDLGLRLALDDFGTGHASLSYLRRFPFDKIKIDKSFVERIIEDPISAAVVRAVSSLGADLGAEVVAEGVETEAQVEALRREGCGLFQGFLFGRPEPWAQQLEKA